MKLTITLPEAYVAAIREKLKTQAQANSKPSLLTPEADYITQVLRQDLAQNSGHLVAAIAGGIAVSVE